MMDLRKETEIHPLTPISIRPGMGGPRRFLDEHRLSWQGFLELYMSALSTIDEFGYYIWGTIATTR